MMRATAHLHRHYAGRQFGREFGYTRPVKPPLQDDTTRSIQTHDAAAVLAEIDPQHRDLHHETLLFLRLPQKLTLKEKGAGHPINFCNLVDNLTKEGDRDTPIEIWFQDEARVGQEGSLTYIWAPVGSRPPMVRDSRHQSAYIFGAICPSRGVGAAMITPTANTECMNLHLAEISTQVSAGADARAVVVCDGAGWHQTGGDLKVPDNILLLHLPPYAPELNPMENVWNDLRANKLSARV